MFLGAIRLVPAHHDSSLPCGQQVQWKKQVGKLASYVTSITGTVVTTFNKLGWFQKSGGTAVTVA
jgi:hypothetical protein